MRSLPIIADPNLQHTELRHTTSMLRSSQPHGWHGVGVYHSRVETQPTFVAAPVALTARMHVLALHTNGVVNLRCRTPRRSYEAVSRPGGLCIMPQGFDGAWSWHGSAEVTHIYLAPELVAVVADEVGRRDPERVSLGERFDAHDPLVYQVGLSLLAELYTPGYGGRLYAESLGATLALHLLRSYAAGAMVRDVPQRSLPPPLLRRILAYIDGALGSELALADLAAVAGLSPSYFLRQFKASTGLAPHQYVLQRRVERAKQLLLEGQHTVAQVAQAAGFHDQSHLNRHFKRAFGVAPRVLLEQRKNRRDHEQIVQDSSETPVLG